jgi:hypothetical protein
MADDDCEDNVVACIILKMELEFSGEKAKEVSIAKAVNIQSCILIKLYFIMIFFIANLITITLIHLDYIAIRRFCIKNIILVKMIFPIILYLLLHIVETNSISCRILRY